MKSSADPGAGVLCSEVRAVLEELLNESTTRMGEINEQLAQLDANIEAAKAAHKKAQEDLAAAIDDHDKATRELHNHDPLEIARLKGIWQQAKISLEQARTRYGTDRKRFQREREIIGRIMAKIDANCAGAPTPESLSPTNSFMGMGAFNPDYKKSECAT
jgi:chromosome segregation ATPase